jgi:hypothetical protein
MTQKSHKFMKTVAAFLALGGMVATPTQQAKSVEVAGKTIEVTKSNKEGIVERKQKKHNIEINDHDGGLDLRFTRIAQTSPIYFPKKHSVESYRSQQRKAKRRRK